MKKIIFPTLCLFLTLFLFSCQGSKKVSKKNYSLSIGKAHKTLVRSAEHCEDIEIVGARNSLAIKKEAQSVDNISVNYSHYDINTSNFFFQFSWNKVKVKTYAVRLKNYNSQNITEVNEIHLDSGDGAHFYLIRKEEGKNSSFDEVLKYIVDKSHRKIKVERPRADYESGMGLIEEVYNLYPLRSPRITVKKEH